MSDDGRVPAPRADWAYFLDLDGTLVDLAPSPAEVRLDDELRGCIRHLHAAAGGALALVTGRSIADVDALLDGPPLPVAGQHGLERRDACGIVRRQQVDLGRIALARDRLADLAGLHPGLALEEKGLSLALHYRAAPSLAMYVCRVMREVRRELGSEYGLLYGKCVVELRPTGSSKGTAVAEIMSEPPFRGRTAVFVGDDATDEDGFAAVNAMGGHSIKVGEGPTIARWRLADVAAVRAWLARRTRTTDDGDTRKARGAGLSVRG
jgi:trehalose 6-phosphate phosphatase